MDRRAFWAIVSCFLYSFLALSCFGQVSCLHARGVSCFLWTHTPTTLLHYLSLLLLPMIEIVRMSLLLLFSVYRIKGNFGTERSKDGLVLSCASNCNTLTSLYQRPYKPQCSPRGSRYATSFFSLSSSYTSNPRNIHSRALKDIVTQHVCFAFFIGCHGARSEVDGSVGSCATTLGERAWIDAED